MISHLQKLSPVCFVFIMLLTGCQTTAQNHNNLNLSQGVNSVDTFIIGKQQYLQGNYERALVNLLESVKTQQSLPDPYIYIGNIFFKNNDLINSIKYYNKAIELERDNLSANHNLLGAHLQETYQILNKLKNLETTSLDQKNKFSNLNAAIEIFFNSNSTETINSK